MNSGIRRKKLPSGKIHYYVYAEVDGREHGCGGFNQKRHADEQLRKIRNELAAGTFDAEDLTFAEFAARWLANDVKPHRGILTYKDYEGIVRNHLAPALGSTKISKVQVSQISNMITRKMEDKPGAGKDGETVKGISAGHAGKVLRVCRMIFKRAEDLRLITWNPATRSVMPTPDGEEMDFLLPDELNRLLNNCEGRAYPMVLTAALSGIRQGELLALRRCDVDLDRQIINVRRTYRPETGFKPPKTKAGIRSVPIGEGVVGALRTQLEEKPGLPEDLVFPSKKGTPIHHTNLTSRDFHPALDRAGLRRVRWHDLRHTYATLMISQGVNPKVLQVRMGHSSIRVTMDTYGHLMPDVDRGIDAKVDSLIFDRKVVPFKIPRKRRE